eukprot:3916120-Prymnesium_polylepis.1
MVRRKAVSSATRALRCLLLALAGTSRPQLMLNISNAEAHVQHMCHRWDASDYVYLYMAVPQGTKWYMARRIRNFCTGDVCLHATARSINMVNRRDARRPHKI